MTLTTIAFSACLLISAADAYSDGLMIRNWPKATFGNILHWSLSQWLWHLAKWTSLFLPCSLWLRWWQWPRWEVIAVGSCCLGLWLIVYNARSIYPRTTFNY